MGISPKGAIEKLGIYLGDDGVSPDLEPKAHERAAKRWGLRLKTAVVQRGDLGVNFLARYYSDGVWFGNRNSMCDVRRQMAKFHLATGACDTIALQRTKLREKALAYALTDRNTPIIGPICIKALELTTDLAEVEPAGWWGKFNAESQWPNEAGDWMEEVVEMLMPGAAIDDAKEWARNCSSWDEFNNPLTVWESDETETKTNAVMVNAETWGELEIQAQNPGGEKPGTEEGLPPEERDQGSSTGNAESQPEKAPAAKAGKKPDSKDKPKKKSYYRRKGAKAKPSTSKKAKKEK
jgi:hypothetical protein